MSLNSIDTLCVSCARTIEVDLDWDEARAIGFPNDNCVTVSRLVVIDGDRIEWECPACEQQDWLTFENTEQENS